MTKTRGESAFLAPMAIALGFGLVFATLITLFLIPSLYLILDDIKKYVGDKIEEYKDRIGEISRAFAKHDVVIAEVGRWCNLLDADAAKRSANLKRVTEGLALAEAVGARCCVDIAGSYNPKVWYGPHRDNLSQEFFDASVENARKIIDAVKPKRARVDTKMPPVAAACCRARSRTRGCQRLRVSAVSLSASSRRGRFSWPLT